MVKKATQKKVTAKKIMGYPLPTKKAKCPSLLADMKSEKKAIKGYTKGGIWIAKDEREHFKYLGILAKEMNCKGIPKL